jgi:hypothetical protein
MERHEEYYKTWKVVEETTFLISPLCDLILQYAVIYSFPVEVDKEHGETHWNKWSLLHHLVKQECIDLWPKITSPVTTYSSYLATAFDVSVTDITDVDLLVYTFDFPETDKFIIQLSTFWKKLEELESVQLIKSVEAELAHLAIVIKQRCFFRILIFYSLLRRSSKIDWLASLSSSEGELPWIILYLQGFGVDDKLIPYFLGMDYPLFSDLSPTGFPKFDEEIIQDVRTKLFSLVQEIYQCKIIKKILS